MSELAADETAGRTARGRREEEPFLLLALPGALQSTAEAGWCWIQSLLRALENCPAFTQRREERCSLLGNLPKTFLVI